MDDYKTTVYEHYKKQAEIHGMSLSSTMPDQNIRRLEIENILKYLNDGETCLEVGCGNGAASIIISKTLSLNLLSIDFSNEMIQLADSQSKNGIKGNLNFQREDILNYTTDKFFDVVFTIRCIINLMRWEDQKIALENMAKCVKSGGKLILLEAFSDGNQELNEARKELGLESIPPAYHNLHLKKELVIEHLARNGLSYTGENNFLSSYYFFTRVFYPALAKANNVETSFNSKIDSFFSNFPPYGNFSHIKILSFIKS